jgi:D-alanyl-D-alanine dipeptidase
MKNLLGMPRNQMTQECANITNPDLARLIVTQNVGPFKVSGLKFAVESLKEVMAEIQIAYPEVYKVLGTAGMLCCRLQRGSKTAVSNHSWGTAIDLTISGKLDTYGDGLVQCGLTQIATIFHKHGWYWGATFRKEDGMHFEVSKNKLEQWKNEGKL